MNQGFNCGYVVYTDIAGFTMMMTSATISMHYDIKKNKTSCINKLQKWVRINSLIFHKVISLIGDE